MEDPKETPQQPDPGTETEETPKASAEEPSTPPPTPEEDGKDVAQYFNTSTVNELLQRRLVSSDANLLSIYDHGFVNGVYKVGQEHFHAYLERNSALKHLQYACGLLEQRWTDLKNRLGEYQAQFRLTREAEARLEGVQAVEDQERVALQANVEERKRVEELAAARWPRHTLLTGIFYMLAAVIFIVADFVISDTIVANAMEMGGMEAKLFAAALAGMSLLFKPIYDRLIEKHYLAGRKTMRFNVFVIILGLLGIALLGILGRFRYDAYITGKQLERQNAQSQVDDFTKEPTPPNASEPTTGAAGADVLESDWALWSFILSAILFAWAGAVCLGIGTPVMNDHWMRWQLGKQRVLLEQQGKELEDRHTASMVEVAKWNAEFQTCTEQLSFCTPPDRLREEIAQVEKELVEARRSMHELEGQTLGTLYQDGHARGASLRDRIQVEWVSTPVHREEEEPDLRGNTIYIAENDRPENRGPGYRSRPFKAIRRIIANDFRQEKRQGGGHREIIDFTGNS